MDLSALYRERRGEFASRESRYRERSTLLSALRLLTALLFVLFCWLALSREPYFWIAAAACVLAFPFLVRSHAAFQWKRDYFGRLRSINEKELDALEGKVEAFSSGERYADARHPYSFDLDIFGRNSLFQHINRCCCTSGEDLLAESLSGAGANPGTGEPSAGQAEKEPGTGANPGTAIDYIVQRQRAIAELGPLVDFRQHFMALGQESPEDPAETRKLLEWIKSPKSRLAKSWIRALSFIFPATVLSLLGLALGGVLVHGWWICMGLINLMITALFMEGVNRTHRVVGRKQGLLQKFGRLLELAGKQSFSDPYLGSLGKEGLDAFKAVRELSGVIDFFDQRLNWMIAPFLNGLLLSDLHCVAAVERWRARHGERMEAWLQALFRIDELNSLANFAFNHPDYSYPEFREKPFIRAIRLGHPLMPRQACVPNDFVPSAEEKVLILTGANMSGKSTFLRSVGVNLVLAYAGAPVFAREFECCLAGIHTSMRVTDSLSEDTSYFYAELKRLSSIMERLRSGERLFVLLDEILKGTNSADKLYGSTGLVREFLRHDCLCLVATHDLQLGELEAELPGLVSNYCFESTLSGNELQFDYTLQKGIARNKNATFLMQKTGLIGGGPASGDTD